MSNILVIGDVMLDETIEGIALRLSPEAPVPVILNPESSFQLGGAANVALNCRDLGAEVTLVSIIGDDKAGEQIDSMSKKFDIHTFLFAFRDMVTTRKLRLKSGAHQFLRCDFEKIIGLEVSRDLVDKIEEMDLLAKHSVIVMSDYGKGAISDVRRLIRICSKLGMKILIDPKGDDFSKYAGATLITPNRSEAEKVFGSIDSEGFEAKIFQYMREHAVENICVTLGADGLRNFHHTGDILNLKSNAINVFDVTGAGDSFVSGVALALAEGKEMSHALDFGNKVAGIAVSKIGTYSVKRSDLLND